MSDVLQAAQTNEDKTITEHWPVWTGCCGHCCCGTRGGGGSRSQQLSQNPSFCFFICCTFSTACMLHPSAVNVPNPEPINKKLNTKRKRVFTFQWTFFLCVFFFTVRVQKRRSEFRAVGWLLLECFFIQFYKKKNKKKTKETKSGNI